MKELELNTVESSELVEQTFDFWFNDNKHIRSPFPDYIKVGLKVKATKHFFEWTSEINPKAKDEINDEMVGEKFEEIIFETALGLIQTEDERITILYPFLPRLGDKLQKENESDSIIVERMIVKEKDNTFLKVELKNMTSDKKWNTRFELPI